MIPERQPRSSHKCNWDRTEHCSGELLGAVHEEKDKTDDSKDGTCNTATPEKTGKAKGRRKRSGRARVIHTAESLHKLYHKPPETVYRTICNDSDAHRDPSVVQGWCCTARDQGRHGRLHTRRKV